MSDRCPEFERYSFKANWFQKEADMCRPFIINVFPKDNSVEIFDERSRKMFMRRSPLDTLNTVNHERATSKQIYVGAKLNIFGRQFDITDYADDVTKFKLASHRESAFCLLKPHAISFMDKILNQFRDERLTIGHLKMVQLDRDYASRLLMQELGDVSPTLPDLMESITQGPAVVLELFGQNAIRKLLDILGPDNPDDAKELCPNSIRAKYGMNLFKNVAFCSKSAASTEVNIRYFFTENQVEPYVTMNGTLAIVKPHAVLDGKLGDIISVIYENDFKVTAMKMMYMERENCEEFLEVYKGVAPEYNVSTVKPF
ncbi:hypothetical protein HA402_015892 [Bradysia odoriphaga]|nr:hypothetical protein HA402_015892 [Bradysia odoriphaga]